MNKYRITYFVLTALSAPTLCVDVEADTEDEAKYIFLSNKTFYNTNDPNNVVIESIRICR